MVQDDLRPISCQGANSQGGIALTLIDALDTLLIMGQPQALRASTAWLSKNLSLDVDDRVHVFELTIRALGAPAGCVCCWGCVRCGDVGRKAHACDSVSMAELLLWYKVPSHCGQARRPELSVKSSTCKRGHVKPSGA